MHPRRTLMFLLRLLFAALLGFAGAIVVAAEQVIEGRCPGRAARRS